jgi:TolA-binding protein
MTIDPNDKKIKQLEDKLARLEQVVKVLSGKISLLERENNRRKTETGQITNAIRKIAQ